MPLHWIWIYTAVHSHHLLNITASLEDLEWIQHTEKYTQLMKEKFELVKVSMAHVGQSTHISQHTAVVTSEYHEVALYAVKQVLVPAVPELPFQ